MPQGALKKSAQPVPRKAKQQRQQKKPSGVTKKKKAKTAAEKLRKKVSAGLMVRTETLMAERAGHLELIGKGKKDKKPAGDGKKAKTTGESRKFG